MSGSSRNYECYRVQEEYSGRMFDPEMDALIDDLVPVLKAVEWYESGDYSEDRYRGEVKKFKDKWLHGRNDKLLISIIDQKINNLRELLMTMIGKDVQDGTAD